MLKKVTDEFADPDDGDALVDNCVTSVTTGRTMAEIAAGEDVWRSNRGGQKGGRAQEEGERGAAAVPASRSSRRWSTRCPPGDSWIHEYKYDGYRLLLAVGDGVATAWTRNGKDWSDKFKALVKAAAKLPAGLPDRRRGGRARRQGQAQLPAAPVDAEGQQGANLVFYAFDLLVDRGEDIRKLPNIERKERLAALLEGVPAADPLRRPCHRPRRGAVPRGLQAGRRRHHLEEGRARPTSGDAHAQLAEDQMHPAAGIRDRRLVGKRQAPRLPLAAARRAATGAS